MRVDTRIAERLKKIQASATLAITSKAKKLRADGKDIVNLAAGEPDFDTPDFIKGAAHKAIDDGFTKYTPSTGIPALKEAISAKFKLDNNLDYSANDIVVSCGAKHSIFNTLFVIVDPGDEVLIPSPYWVSYPAMVHLCGGKPRIIKTSPARSFKMSPRDLEKHITPRVKALILNTPSNPTGCVYTRDELGAIADICVREKIFIISDEIYEKLIYDGLRHVSIGSLGQQIKEWVITVNGVSKTYSMTGWRIGYLGGPEDVVKAISKLQDHSTSNPASISQKAALAALEGDASFTNEVRDEFQRRRDYCVNRLNHIDKLTCFVPQGAFYIFCNIEKTKLDASTFAARLLDETYVGLIPGEGFGADSYVRISFATGIEQLEKGMNRLEDWVKKI